MSEEKKNPVIEFVIRPKLTRKEERVTDFFVRLRDDEPGVSEVDTEDKSVVISEIPINPDDSFGDRFMALLLSGPEDESDASTSLRYLLALAFHAGFRFAKKEDRPPLENDDLRVFR